MIFKFLRLFKIVRVATRYGLDDIALSSLANPRTAKLFGAVFFWRDISAPRGVRLRQALEDLGPIFVKFGQVLSTRRDLLPADIADELAKLQDRVPPFDPDLALATIERSIGRPLSEVFASLERTPIASASIAQVHLGTLKDGREVAVKVLRPGVERDIAKDLALLQAAASLVERLS